MDGSLWLAFGRLEAGYLLRFPELADFVVSNDARLICGYRRANCPPESMRHLLLNQVIPIVLGHSGRMVLHASACATSRGAMAFLGKTGMGKSTLAASFGLQGFAILTDDCLLIERQGQEIMTVPSYPGLRLWPESVKALFDKEPALQPLAHYTDKKRILFEQNHPNGSRSLSAIYVLSEWEKSTEKPSVRISPLTPAQAMLEAVRHTFTLDVTDRERLTQAFRRYEWLAKSVPFFRLAFPRRHALLSHVNQVILNHLGFIEPQPQSVQ
jgi:hypothetical protein